MTLPRCQTRWSLRLRLSGYAFNLGQQLVVERPRA
jgi:hypothetical protein